MRDRSLALPTLFALLTTCLPCGAQEFLDWTLEVPYPAIDFGNYADVVVEPDTGRVAACAVRESGAYTTLNYIRYFGRDGWLDDWRGWVWGETPGADFGEHLSMAVILTPDGLRTGFAYHNVNDASLEYMEYPVFDVEVIADSGSLNQGRSNALVFAPDGVAHIATRTTSILSDDWLVHAYRIGSGGNCGVGDAAGVWQCDTVSVAEGIAEFISVAMDENGHPMIAYSSGAGTLNVAVHAPSGLGNCGYGDAAGMWQCSSLVASTRATSIGGRVALALDPNSPATGKHLAFLTTNTTSGEQSLDYATWVGSGGSCTDSRWNCMALVDVGSGTVDLDLAVDGDGMPLIVYRDSSFGEVRLAWGSNGTAGSGNCGPSNSWRCDVINEEPFIGSVGAHVAIAVGPDGQPVVAYSSFDFLASDSDLRIVHPWISRDFFETGDLMWWDAEQP